MTLLGDDYVPAFPQSLRTDPRDRTWEGMSLRDYFAGQALDSILLENEADAGRVAAYAYRVADAMLMERTK